MKFYNWHKNHFEAHLMGRYVTPKHLTPLLELYSDTFKISKVGTSEEQRDIHCFEIGHGKIKVLAWSQMHGNESTTTKALFDFFKFLTQKEAFQVEIEAFLSTYTLYIVPILNPDGATLYTRENAKGIDLNRDAHNRTQSESKVLHHLFTELQPDICLNLHDQRSIYSLPNNQPATVSFLAPAADATREVTTSRKLAMEHIVVMNDVLQSIIPEKVGRYDDEFNENCVGDSFQMAGVPTILFEAGHYPNDYNRERSRAYIFVAFCTLFGILGERGQPNYKAYFEIPENKKLFRDILIRNVIVQGYNSSISLAIQYEEVLENEHVRFLPVLEEIDPSEPLMGHFEVDAKNSEILINNYENVFVNQKIDTIVDKNAINTVFFKDSCNEIG